MNKTDSESPARTAKRPRGAEGGLAPEQAALLGRLPPTLLARVVDLARRYHEDAHVALADAVVREQRRERPAAAAVPGGPWAWGRDTTATAAGYDPFLAAWLRKRHPYRGAGPGEKGVADPY